MKLGLGATPPEATHPLPEGDEDAQVRQAGSSAPKETLVLSRLLIPTVACALAAGGWGAVAAQAAPGEGPRRVQVEAFDRGGPLGHVAAPARSPYAQSDAASRLLARGLGKKVVNWSVTGAKPTRLDVTILGDGYTAAQQDDFIEDGKRAWTQILEVEPYRSYAGLFNVRLVKTPSQQTGVTNDPDKGYGKRKTALGAYFNCANTVRLICVNLNKVGKAASAVGGTDFVLVLANSKAYGGAGYPGVSTMSSDNDQSDLIAVHEAGHSVGGLGDEYEYAGWGTHPKGEPPYPNISLKKAAALQAQKAKWWRWLGYADPTGSTVGAYEGGDYYPKGVYRPTQNSLMRAFDSTSFNAPSTEALIGGFYGEAAAVTAKTKTGEKYPVTKELKLKVAPLPAGLSQVSIRWYVDGVEVPAARGLTSFVPKDHGVTSAGSHTIACRAIDKTDAVRRSAVRNQSRVSYQWKVT